jgi:hypothetical protein
MTSAWLCEPYSQAFPLSHLLRAMAPHAWMRIHSLPESKRYASNDLEREVVFERYRRFGSALLGEGSPCSVIQARLNQATPDSDWLPKLDWKPLYQNVETEDEVWSSWIAPTSWKPDEFRSLLMAIADDKVRAFAFLSATTDAVFIPYDGGADGFSLDQLALQQLSSNFRSWSSKHPAGL